jgi:hypothetical protein
MPREKQNFRAQLERIDEAFPDKEILNRKEVSAYTGICYNSVSKYFTLNKGKITKVELARQMS